jgi:hypothetical protein
MQSALEPFIERNRLSVCQELTARLFGYDDWHELIKSVGSAPESVDDLELEASAVLSRRDYQVQRLTEAGIAQSTACYLVETLHPTARKVPELGSKVAFCQHISLLAHAFAATKFSLHCSGTAAGTLSYWVLKQDGFVLVIDPVNRPSLAAAAINIFGEGDEKAHHADRVSVLGHHRYVAWRTQWYGENFYPEYTGIKTNAGCMLVGVGRFPQESPLSQNHNARSHEYESSMGH